MPTLSNVKFPRSNSSWRARASPRSICARRATPATVAARASPPAPTAQQAPRRRGGSQGRRTGKGRAGGGRLFEDVWLVVDTRALGGTETHPPRGDAHREHAATGRGSPCRSLWRCPWHSPSTRWGARAAAAAPCRRALSAATLRTRDRRTLDARAGGGRRHDRPRARRTRRRKRCAHQSRRTAGSSQRDAVWWPHDTERGFTRARGRRRGRALAVAHSSPRKQGSHVSLCASLLSCTPPCYPIDRRARPPRRRP